MKILSADLERVRLRPFGVDDAPSLYALYSDPETMRYLVRPRMTDPSQAEEMLAKALAAYEDGSNLQLAIERRSDRAFLGACLLFRFDAPSRRAEIGYILGQAHWGQGYLSEALPALIDHGFGELKLNRLEADVDPRNEASMRVLDRMGFRREGLLRERCVVNGQPADSAVFGLLKREWVGRDPV